jgi:hypothetical protein
MLITGNIASKASDVIIDATAAFFAACLPRLLPARNVETAVVQITALTKAPNFPANPVNSTNAQVPRSTINIPR